MIIDLHARAPSISLSPIILLRWLASISQLLVIAGADALFGLTLPVKPMLMLVAASFAVNLFAMTYHRKRQVPEEIVRLHLVFDIIQFCGLLYFSGGTENPFSILLLAPLTMAASVLSLYNLCLLLMLTVLCVSILTFAALPLAWPEPAPVFTDFYHQGTWVALMLALIFISFIIWRLAMEGRHINDALAQTRAILEEKRRLSSLGALAAAAVHELGSPLGTIAVVTREMERDIHPDDPLAEDVALLRAETEKCKKILADIARNPNKAMELGDPLRLDRLLMEIAHEQAAHGRGVTIDVHSRVPENLPALIKTPNLEYGLGNIISNAASFAQKTVHIGVEGSAETVEIIISDDGPGFPPLILQSVGQPYISSRESRQHHLGLGVFISINLLEATGATLFFANAPENGAVVRVVWPRSALEPAATQR